MSNLMQFFLSLGMPQLLTVGRVKLLDICGQNVLLMLRSSNSQQIRVAEAIKLFLRPLIEEANHNLLWDFNHSENLDGVRDLQATLIILQRSLFGLELSLLELPPIDFSRDRCTKVAKVVGSSAPGVALPKI
jgi:hypothetical protein